MGAKKIKILELSRLDGLDKVESTVAKIMKESGFDDESIYGAVVSVVEAVTNAIKHGNRYNPLKKTMVFYHKTKRFVSFVICDDGEGFDPSAVPDPTRPENIEKTNGRGIFLMRSLMDDVKFYTDPRTGTTVEMLKYLTPPRPTKGS
jgi:serine/threonine-protein kinase RsbW